MTTAFAAADATAPPLPDHFSFRDDHVQRLPEEMVVPPPPARPTRSSSASSLLFGGSVHAALGARPPLVAGGSAVRRSADAMEAFDAHWHAESSLADVRFGKGEDGGAAGAGRGTGGPLPRRTRPTPAASWRSRSR